jgi:hypothetical protein
MAPVGLHDGIGNGQAETAVPTIARACFVGTIETLENVRKVLGSYAGSRVRDD